MKTKEFKEECLQMIEDCENRESRLSDWDNGFIESISNWLAEDKDLTNNQYLKLEEIWEKATKNG